MEAYFITLCLGEIGVGHGPEARVMWELLSVQAVNHYSHGRPEHLPLLSQYAKETFGAKEFL